MDATRLRELVDAAISAQNAFDAAELAKDESYKTRDAARERQIKELGNLRAAIGNNAVIYGDKLVRVAEGAVAGLTVIPLVTVPVLAPPPAPLPEAPPAKPPVPAVAPVKATAPLAGGTVPPLGKKN